LYTYSVHNVVQKFGFGIIVFLKEINIFNQQGVQIIVIHISELQFNNNAILFYNSTV